MDDFVNNFYKLDGHSIAEYERSHKHRLDFLVEDLKLNRFGEPDYLKESVCIGDFGCGYAPIFRRMTDKNRHHGGAVIKYGFDGDSSASASQICSYHQCDLNLPISGTRDDLLDFALCFETLEHLTNPYVCLSEIKRILKKEGVLYLSIPHDSCTHNTIYPGLLYPVENFKEFLSQMAFEIEDYRIHNKAFSQHVFTLRNKPWSHVRMKWNKSEEKFRNQPPHIQVNL